MWRTCPKRMAAASALPHCAAMCSAVQLERAWSSSVVCAMPSTSTCATSSPYVIRRLTWYTSSPLRRDRRRHAEIQHAVQTQRGREKGTRVHTR